MFYTVFSTNDTPYMQWQSDLLEYSWKRVEQEGVLIRLVATNTPHNLPAQRFAHCIATRSWDTHPQTGDFWPIYNKPASLLEWVYRENPNGTVLLIDPDCIFRKAISTRVAPGSPIAQAWVDFESETPSEKHPFGFSNRFAALKDHCLKTDLTTEPVMIPTLIHTSDLKMICARWLELCGIVREHCLQESGEPIWEADMFAYLAACAEYGLRHEPAAIGVCTNWALNAAPGAPIVHYCKTIFDGDGDGLFGKSFFEPWSRISTSKEPEMEYGRDLVTMINDYIDDTSGVTRQPPPYGCPQPQSGAMEGRVADEFLLELPEQDKRLWLNTSGRMIWEMCDGMRTIDNIGTELAARHDASERAIKADVMSTIGQLYTAGFLEIH